MSPPNVPMTAPVPNAGTPGRSTSQASDALTGQQTLGQKNCQSKLTAATQPALVSRVRRHRLLQIQSWIKNYLSELAPLLGNRQRHGSCAYGSRTRFIPPAILDDFEERSWAPPCFGSKANTAVSQTVDLASRMKEMWR